MRECRYSPRFQHWRARKLDFSDTPLGDAIAEANRYSRVQIELNAPELQGARISGTFEAGRNDPLFVEGLQTYFQLNVEHPADAPDSSDFARHLRCESRGLRPHDVKPVCPIS